MDDPTAKPAPSPRPSPRGSDGFAVDLMLVGHVALDQVVIRGEERRRTGGAVYFGSFAARASGASCLVVTRLAPSDAGLLRELEDAGIGVHWTKGRETTGIRNIYTTDDQDRRTCVLIHAGDPISVEDIPDVPARIIHVGPLLAGQVPEQVVEHLARRAPLGLDVQGFVRVAEGRDLANRAWPGAARLLRLVTYLKADAAEAEVLTGETDLDRAAAALAAMGPREVVLTHASGLRVLAGGEMHRARFDPRSLEGRTGRGDTCMAAYLAARALGRDPARACRWAAALTSLKLERDGPFRGTTEEVLRRITPSSSSRAS